MNIPIEAGNGIPAPQMKRMRLGEPVPELFQPQGGLRFTSLPQEGDHFSENGDGGIRTDTGGRRPGNDGANNFAEQRFVGKAVPCESGQGFGGIEGHITALADGRRQIYSAPPKFLRETFAMGSGSDDNCGASGFEFGPHERGDGSNKKSIIEVKLDVVLAGSTDLRIR